MAVAVSSRRAVAREGGQDPFLRFYGRNVRQCSGVCYAHKARSANRVCSGGVQKEPPPTTLGLWTTPAFSCVEWNTKSVCTVHGTSPHAVARIGAATESPSPPASGGHPSGLTAGCTSVKHRLYDIIVRNTVTIFGCAPIKLSSNRPSLVVGTQIQHGGVPFIRSVLMYTLSCPARFVSSSRYKFASGSEAKAGVPVNSGGVFKSVLAAMAIASYRELMTVTLRRQRGNKWQVVLFNLTHPSCCQMEYTLCCILLGEKVSFPVKIKDAQLVGELKDEIKKKTQRLALFDALDLNLYPLNMVVSDMDYPKVKQTIIEKTFECKETHELQPEFELSVYFGDTNPPKPGAVHIVVVPPQSKSIGP